MTYKQRLALRSYSALTALVVTIWTPAVCGVASLAAFDREQQQATFRSTSDLVLTFVSVTDRSGRSIGGLGPTDFVVRDDGQEVGIAGFASDEVPMAISILLSRSALLRDGYDAMTTAADTLIRGLGPSDVAGIANLTHGPAVLSTSARSAVLGLPIWGGEMSVWDGLAGALHSFGDWSGRKMVVFVSAGYENDGPIDFTTDETSLRRRPSPSEGSPERVVAGFQHSGAALYVLRVDSRSTEPGVERLAADTGGRVTGYSGKSGKAGLATTVEALADDMRHAYLLGFKPVKRDGQTHKIEVTYSKLGAVVRSRTSYRAPVSIQ